MFPRSQSYRQISEDCDKLGVVEVGGEIEKVILQEQVVVETVIFQEQVAHSSSLVNWFCSATSYPVG